MLKQWLKLCPPSFVICSDCSFFLDFISSRTQSLQIFFFSKWPCASTAKEFPNAETQPIHWRAQKCLYFQVNALPFSFLQAASSFPWSTFPLFHPDVSGRPWSSSQTPKDGDLGFSQENLVGSWKLGLKRTFCSMESCNFPSGFLRKNGRKRYFFLKLLEETGDQELQPPLMWGERWIGIDRGGFP